jgi:hypothetical protein
MAIGGPAEDIGPRFTVETLAEGCSGGLRWAATRMQGHRPHQVHYFSCGRCECNALHGLSGCFSESVRWYVGTLCGTNRCTCVPTCSPCIAPTQPLHSGRTRPLGHAQEDQCVAVAIPGLPEHYLFGVFDGHGGAACAKAAAGHDEGVLR